MYYPRRSLFIINYLQYPLFNYTLSTRQPTILGAFHSSVPLSAKRSSRSQKLYHLQFTKADEWRGNNHGSVAANTQRRRTTGSGEKKGKKEKNGKGKKGKGVAAAGRPPSKSPVTKSDFSLEATSKLKMGSHKALTSCHRSEDWKVLSCLHGSETYLVEGKDRRVYWVTMGEAALEKGEKGKKRRGRKTKNDLK